MNFDWKKPRCRITLTKRGEVNPVTVLVGQPSASGRWFTSGTPPRTPWRGPRERGGSAPAPPVAYQDRSVLKFPQDRAAKWRSPSLAARP